MLSGKPGRLHTLLVVLTIGEGLLTCVFAALYLRLISTYHYESTTGRFLSTVKDGAIVDQWEPRPFSLRTILADWGGGIFVSLVGSFLALLVVCVFATSLGRIGHAAVLSAKGLLLTTRRPRFIELLQAIGTALLVLGLEVLVYLPPPLTKALIWALERQPNPTLLKWSAAVLIAAFFWLLLFAFFQYETSERRWGAKLVLGLLGLALLFGLGTSAFHWVTGALYGLGYLLTWLAWVLTRRCSWWRRALARGLTAGLTLGPWLWLGQKQVQSGIMPGVPGPSAHELGDWLLAPTPLMWFWMALGFCWLLLLVGGWGCWCWPVGGSQRRRCLVVTWAVFGFLGLNWYVASRGDLCTVCAEGPNWRLRYTLMSWPGCQWYRGVNGVTPLHVAAANGKCDAIRLLLAAGAHVEARVANWGWTPLHLAAQKGQPEATRLLLGTGADAKGTDKSGYTPLHYAAGNGCLKAVRLLLTAGADVNAKTEDRMTALFAAVLFHRQEVARLVLAAGAKVNERTRAGKTALDVAPTDACRTLLRQAGGKTGADLDAEQATPAQEPVKSSEPGR